ncbi:MAG: hypothetical protein Q8922_00370 [Bacteroidota bacterium]|nr:hypothetical protein [Bacteroidota bacterium]MDP4232488.1 hypothetical protein [Bacteroidota bacterium]MDP4241623.1 hypothetical protein [Bacteroidota bacterium]MDP4286367.1 hypothetical protein [Bacteroidota bacterium]
MAVKAKTKKTTASRVKHTRKAVRNSANPPENTSELGRKLLAIRKRIEESGIPLLTLEEIRREHAEQQREAFDVS